jgi:glutamate-1-semialdehyde 2,1-aminomutase
LDASILSASRRLGAELGRTGRLIFSLNYTEPDFEQVAERFIAAAKAMQRDGWWWSHSELTNKSIKRAILKETIARRLFA